MASATSGGGSRLTMWLNMPRDPELDTFALQASIGLFAFWWFMFFIVGNYHYLPSSWRKILKPYDELVIRHRIVDMYNGAGMFCVSLYWYLNDNDYSCSKRNTRLEIFTFCNLAAHFIWDLTFMWWHGFLDMGNFMHHAFGITIYYTTLFQQYNFNFTMMHLLPGEFTNVSMHIREVFKRLGYRYTWLYYFNEYFYCFFYTTCRTIWIPWVYLYIFPCESANPVIWVFYPCHCVQSWYYVSKLPKLWSMRNEERSKLKKAGLTLRWFEPITEEQVKEAKIVSREVYKM